MDFGSLLHVAQKNEKKPKTEIKYYSTKFEPPKKEERSKQLSHNIKKFLARKEAEEKQKVAEAQVRRDELLALRSQDRKATRRVSVMLKRTKSANKSVISDAIDNDNTAVTLVGPSQPDEDDYGYVSQEASAFYNKMMQKYSTVPNEEKFPKSKKNTNTNLKEIKDRVSAAILKEQEDALLPHKRKRKPKDGTSKEADGDIEEYREESKYRPEPEKKSKPKPRPPPPTLNFNDLLKIAEKKQFEPIKIESKVVEEERLMTKKQKREFEKEQAWKERKEKGLIAATSDTQKMPPPNKIPKLSSNNNNGRIPKLISSEERPPQKIPKISDDRNSQRPSISGSKPIPRKPDDRNIDRSISKKYDDKLSLKRSDDKLSLNRSDDKLSSNRNDDKLGLKRSDDRNNISKRPDDRNDYKKSDSSRPDPNKVSKLRAELEKNRSVNVKNSSSPRPSLNTNNPNLNRSSNSKVLSNNKNKILVKRDANGRPIKQLPTSDLKLKQFPQSSSDLKPKKFPPTDLKPKQFPPADLKPRQFPPTDVRPKFPSKNVKRKPPMGLKGRILDDDDSEYDSEMDDFIDDGPEGAEDYSKYISEIFGYDKSRYRHEVDDAADMESSFSEVMKEEFISGKLGLMEDLEDMKLEAEEKKRKALMKQKMMRK